MNKLSETLRAYPRGPDDAVDWQKAQRTMREAADALDMLEEAVEHAEYVFRHYAELHDAKGTNEGRTKAKRNEEHAERMAAALANIRKGQDHG